jgi:hypothetical protein
MYNNWCKDESVSGLNMSNSET